MGETPRIHRSATVVRAVTLVVLLAAVPVLIADGDAVTVPAVTIVLIAGAAVAIATLAYQLFTVDAPSSGVLPRLRTSTDRFLIVVAVTIASCAVVGLGWFRIQLHDGHAPLLAFDRRAIESARRHSSEYHVMNTLNMASIRSMVVLGTLLVIAALAVRAFRSAPLLAATMALAGGLVEVLKTTSQPSFSAFGPVVGSAVSWPSGHAALECSLAFGIVMWWWAAGLPRPALVAAFVVPVAVLVGYSRAFVGIHLLSEVLAGWGVAVLAGAVVLAGDRLLAPRIKLPTPSKRWPLVATVVVVLVLFAVSLRPLRHFHNRFRGNF